ncbi:hypothetical protein [Streptomyces sp. NPDC006368]|uniref:hypothetical protein n=1 Tax=Streptomyces sp. NPDC006368 TaxID=3156760 RepID=UPI0033B2CD31
MAAVAGGLGGRVAGAAYEAGEPEAMMAACRARVVADLLDAVAALAALLFVRRLTAMRSAKTLHGSAVAHTAALL